MEKFERVQVNLGERSYPIYIGKGILEGFASFLKKHIDVRKVFIITDSRVFELYFSSIFESLRREGISVFHAVFPEGEKHKNLKTVSMLYNKLIKAKIERNEPVVALGGGVAGDVAGFVASTYLRGVPFIQIPTTLLSQVDSSVGGKTGINHRFGKNLIGTFYQPILVFIDIDVLKSLEERDYLSGMAEVIKYGIIKDKALFEVLESKRDDILRREPGLLMLLIKRACEIKAEIVEEDERERGLRSILNFGHTFGHAFEAWGGYKRFTHGEAIAIGMVAAARLSFLLGCCEKTISERIEGIIRSYGLPADLPDISGRFLIKYLERDKKIKEGKVRLVLTEGIGCVRLRPVEVEELIGYLSRIKGCV